MNINKEYQAALRWLSKNCTLHAASGTYHGDRFEVRYAFQFKDCPRVYWFSGHGADGKDANKRSIINAYRALSRRLHENK